MGTISINQQPAPVGDLLAVYAPIKYEIAATTSYGNAPLVKAQVYINGGVYKTPYPQFHLSYIGGIYYFNFDVSEILRTYMSNTDTMNLGGNTNTIPPADQSNSGFSRKCEFKVVFELWEPSGVNGIYENSGTDATSSTLYAINIAPSQFLLESEIPNYGSVLPFKFLTSAPEVATTQIDGKAYLSFWDTGATRRGVEIKTYDSNGVLQNTAYIDIGQPLGSVYRVRRIAVGGADINLITPLAGIFSYTITVVEDITDFPTIPISETRTYFIGADACEAAYTLHFLNQFGADDNMQFQKYTILQNTKKQSYLANVSEYPTATNRGATTLSSVGQQVIILQDEAVPQRIMHWVYEAQNTVQAFLQKRGSSELIAVIIEEISNVEAYGVDKSKRDIEIVCTLSNMEYAQQN